jgi:type 1 glutamine amidotransferase
MGARRAAAALVVAAAVAAGPAGCSSGDGGLGTGGASPRFRILVFTRTTAYRHASIPAGVAAIRRLGHVRRFAVDQTADEGRFTDAGLARYAAVVFLSTTGEPLSRAVHRRALRHYIERGGGFVGVHAASDSFYDWPWYVGLVGASFRRHASGTPEASVVVEDRRTAATARLPQVWRRADEWYAFRSDPRGRVHVLATVDEHSYRAGDATMGADHPIAWCQRYDGGRSVYTAMGHTSASYREPLFAAHLLGVIEMAAGRAPFRCAVR